MEKFETAYEVLKRKIEAHTKEKGFKSTLSGKNSDDEDVIIIAYEDCIKTKTMQKNGWIRTNVYYKDGSSEETFEK